MKHMLLIMIMSVFLVFAKAELRAENKFGKMWNWAFESYEEYMSMPEYCIAKFSPKKHDRLRDKYIRSIGADHIHFHHY